MCAIINNQSNNNMRHVVELVEWRTADPVVGLVERRTADPVVEFVERRTADPVVELVEWRTADTVVELVEWQTADSRFRDLGIDTRTRLLFLLQKLVLYHGWSGVVLYHGWSGVVVTVRRMVRGGSLSRITADWRATVRGSPLSTINFLKKSICSWGLPFGCFTTVQ